MSFTQILSIAGQLILSLSILVVLHECGHFFPAKWFNTRVEKFYLFFDPWFSLFKVKKGDTEYGLGWIPFGGYVKISGMVDESMDIEQLKQPPQPWEFRSKPAWQRLIIMIGGVVVNFILGFFIFAMILFTWGRSYYKNVDVKYGIAVDSLGTNLGLRDGDKIVSVGGVAMDKFSAGFAVKQIVLNNANVIKVQRNGQEIDLQVPAELAGKLTTKEYKNKEIYSIRYPQKIESVKEKSLGEKAGLKKGDVVISINNNPNVVFAHEFAQEIRRHKNETVTLSVVRGVDTLSLTSKLDSTSTLGVGLAAPDQFLTVSKEKFSLMQALPEGVKEGTGFLSDQISAFGQMFKGKINVTDNLGSIFSVATLFDPSWTWEKFWRITAMLSVILAFFNILPIPALDGGYVLFLLIESITGKKFSDKFMEVVTTAGFLILITLMLLAIGLDINRFFR
ncbi:MAG: RIP metalloprotease RseP [Saprospiraceae bacterium]|nr:RIP metalloprotease RseP [Saprospiraceae bacterium]MBK7789719.1 RIP metalloprotease RseP [Saprospiraceae bacterium]MBK8112408.1 RIP metalloprotease RseP [Saprospiraceae bacterium]MBK9689405.1 RIP metalloprotease RseP [Saprospiraceae bacterium]MBL0082596.1 RIP metalloprotease RseP [Saprospiraceae bacterium]